MTDFEYGFMKKCAEHGLSQGQAGFLCKLADYDFGRQGAAPTFGPGARPTFGPGSSASAGGSAPVPASQNAEGPAPAPSATNTSVRPRSAGMFGVDRNSAANRAAYTRAFGYDPNLALDTYKVTNPVDRDWISRLDVPGNDAATARARQRFVAARRKIDAGEQGTAIGRAFGNFTDWIGLTDRDKRMDRIRERREEIDRAAYRDTMQRAFADEADEAMARDYQKSLARQKQLKEAPIKLDPLPDEKRDAKEPEPARNGADSSSYASRWATPVWDRK